MATPRHSLEDIYLFPQDYINKFLILNNRQPSNNLTDRLSATILFHNGALLLETDEKYVTDPIFNFLYLFSDRELKRVAENNDIAIADRIKMIRAIIHKFDAYNQEIMQKKLDEAAKKGDTNTAQIIALKSKFKLDYNEAMANAAEGGHKEIVKLMLDLGADNYGWAMAYAARGGYMNIVQLMLNKGVRILDPTLNTPQVHFITKNYDWAMALAAYGGHIKIVQLMLKKGAKDYNWAMEEAARGGQMDILQLMLDKGVKIEDPTLNAPVAHFSARKYDMTMAWAAQGGHMEIVELMLNLGADDYNRAMAFAADGGHIDIVQLMLDLGATSYNWAMEEATKGGHTEIVQLMLDLGAKVYML